MCRIFSAGHEDDRRNLQREIDRIEPKIRRRLRGKYQRLLQRAYDLDDVLASTRRRLDEACVKRVIHALREEELLAYARQIAERVVLDELRRQRRERALHKALGSRLDPHPENHVSDANEIVDHLAARLNREEREALDLWMRGHTERDIADQVNVSVEAYRSRRRRLWKRLRDEAAGPAGDSHALAAAGI